MTKVATKKSGWGGARAGAGRKSPGTGRSKPCKIVTLPAELWEEIDKRGRSEFLRAAAEEKLEREKSSSAPVEI